MPINLRLQWADATEKRHSAKLMGLDDTTTLQELKDAIAGFCGIETGTQLCTQYKVYP
jgi:hypothetical protein